ncbi:MAG: lipopolysaccharide biosynthesis protein [Bacilli bacterium]
MRSKKAMYNIISSLMLQVVVLISGFIVPKLIISSFGSDVNGLVSSISQFLAYISLLESGIGPVVKASLYKPIAEKDNKTIRNILRASEKFFRVIALIFIVYLVGLSIIYPLIVQKEFGYFYTLSLILIISISTFFEYYFGMTYKLYLQAEQKTYVTSIIQIVTYILNIIFVILLVKFGTSIQIIKLFSGFTFILRPLIQNIYIKKKYNINLKDADENYKLDKKWDGLAQHIAAVVHNNTDITILTIFSKLSEVSVYSIYAMITNGVKSIILAFSGGIDASFGDMIAKNEKELLNKNFSTYELFYFTIVTIFYTCTILLIVPFVNVYMMGINDTNYIRPLFGCLLVLSEFVWAIRVPYSSITLAAGHFKETRKGAWIEVIINITISIILVIKYGIVGVAIGTLVAMLVRTIEFIYHTNKYILERNIFINIKKIAVIVTEVLLIILVIKFIPINITFNSYINWIIYAVIVFVVASIITIGINILVYRDDIGNLKQLLKNNFGKLFKRRKK